jgi:hypothetical protein
MLDHARQLGVDAVALVRRMAEQAAGQHGALLEEARRVERVISDLPKGQREVERRG